MNRKRVQRLWREEGLRVPQRRRKRRRLGESTVPAKRLRAEHPNHVWALDFQFDQTADGRILKLLHVVDEFTREALAITCARRIDADATVAVLDRLIAERKTAPGHIRCDNGPELTANALRDWCRFTHAASAYIEPGSPWQNPYVESFGSRVRDELLGVELFQTLTEAQVMVADWRQDYNERPHSSLGMTAPRPGLAPEHPRPAREPPRATGQRAAERLTARRSPPSPARSTGIPGPRPTRAPPASRSTPPTGSLRETPSPPPLRLNHQPTRDSQQVDR